MSQIKFNYKNKDYTLEITRRSATVIERNGFVLEEVSTKPNVMIPLLVQGAFLKYHQNLKPSKIEEIFENIANKNALVQALLEMYAETVNTLTGGDEDEEETKGNVTWEKVQ